MYNSFCASFKLMRERKVATAEDVNKMMAMHLCFENYPAVMDLFYEAEKQFQYSDLCWTIVIDAMARANHIDGMLILHEQYKLHDSPLLRATLIRACINTSRFNDALRLVDETRKSKHSGDFKAPISTNKKKPSFRSAAFPERDFLFALHVSADCLPENTFTSPALFACLHLLTVAADMSCDKDVQNLAKQLKKTNIRCLIYNSLLLCASHDLNITGPLSTPMQVLSEMRNRKIDVLPNMWVVACKTLLSAGGDHTPFALELFERIREVPDKDHAHLHRGKEPIYTELYNKVLEQKTNISDFTLLFDEMVDRKKMVPAPNHVFTRMGAYCKTVNVEGAEKLAAFMKKHHPSLIDRVYSMLVEVYSRAGRFESCLKIYQEVRNDKDMPFERKEVVVNNLLDACGVMGQIDMLEKIWTEIMATGEAVNTNLFTSMVEAYCSNDLCVRACDIIDLCQARKTPRSAKLASTFAKFCLKLNPDASQAFLDFLNVPQSAGRYLDVDDRPLLETEELLLDKFVSTIRTRSSGTITRKKARR